MNITLVSILTTFVTTFIAAVFGSYLALHKFKKEKLWQEKYAAYRDLISAIENIQFWGNEVNSSSFFLPQSGFPEGKEPGDFLSDALRKVDHYSVVGRLLFSDKFCKLLHEFRQELYTKRFDAQEEFDGVVDPREQEWHIVHNASAIRDIVQAYLPKIIAAAKREL